MDEYVYSMQMSGHDYVTSGMISSNRKDIQFLRPQQSGQNNALQENRTLITLIKKRDPAGNEVAGVGVISYMFKVAQ